MEYELIEADPMEYEPMEVEPMDYEPIEASPMEYEPIEDDHDLMEYEPIEDGHDHMDYGERGKMSGHVESYNVAFKTFGRWWFFDEMRVLLGLMRGEGVRGDFVTLEIFVAFLTSYGNQRVPPLLGKYAMKIEAEAMDYEPDEPQAMDYEPVEAEAMDYEPDEVEAMDYEPVEAEAMDYEPVEAKAMDYEPVEALRISHFKVTTFQYKKEGC
nr:hypothetical protein [Tanacetum cinerariifolium]